MSPFRVFRLEMFSFSYGVTVFWGLGLDECLNYLSVIKEFEDHSLDEIEKDEFTFVFGDTAKIVEDEVILPNQDMLTRLAVSHGIAQSVKLGTFERAFAKLLTTPNTFLKNLPNMAESVYPAKEIRRKMGELFIERNSINLHVDVLDTPEFFWEYSELEPYYAMTANYLDIETASKS